MEDTKQKNDAGALLWPARSRFAADFRGWGRWGGGVGVGLRWGRGGCIVF
jgi:hypothetical protein